MAKPLHSTKHGVLKVLSVDDDQVNLMVIEQLLEPQGWLIESAVSGDEALEALNGETWPDFVFLDFNLDVGDSGDEVCRKMRKIFGSTAVPIVMCTAMTAGSSALDKCMEAGASDYLLKPYERTKMIEKVQHHCGAKAMPGGLAAGPAGSEAPAAALAAVQSVQDFCKQLDLEYCGRKLQDAGITTQDLKTLDDAGLRKAGIVVKGQRDKILEAAKAL